MREEIQGDPQRMVEGAMKTSEILKQIPPEVKIKSRYVFGAGANMRAIVVFDVQKYEQLMPTIVSLAEFFQLESFPVIDNSEEAVQQAIS